MSCPAVIEVYAATGPVVVEVITPGPPGPIGSRWLTGESAPGSGVGVVGDYYLRANGDVYGPKTSGGWGSVQFTLTGSGGAALSDDTPQALGTAGAGTSIRASRSDHRHAMPTAAQVGADAAGTAVAAVTAHLAAADPHPIYTTAAEAAAAAPVQSVALSAPSGWSTSTANVGGSVTLTLGLPAGYSLPSTTSQGQWDTAYAERAQWDGGSTGLNAATGRTSLGLGSAAQAATSDFATAAQGSLAATAVQGNDSRLSDAREWSAATATQAEAEAGSSTARMAFTPQRVFQAIASWWSSSAAATKLAGIAAGATANATDAQLRDRSTHTGTQAAGTITGLAASATTDATNAGNISSGTLAAGRLPASGATAGSYGSSSLIPVLTIDATGRVTAASTAAASSFDPASPGAIGATTPAAGTFTRLLLPAQGSAPATPGTGFTLYANSSNALSWVGANGWVRTFDGTANTASRTYTLPDTSGTVALAEQTLPLTFTASTITYAATVDLDMAALAGGYRTISLTGNLTFTTNNRASGRQVTIRLVCDATQRTLTFPAGWVFIGTKPSNIAASKTAVLSLTFFGTADTDCVAAYGVQA